LDALPPAIGAAVWRGISLGAGVSTVISSGFACLDDELPGSGWPSGSCTEILQAQPSVAEWRLLAPAIKQVVAAGKDVVVVGPPKVPHLPGLQRIGLDERRLVWVHAETPAERLWVTEQLVKANATGLLLSWLPQARQEQIRRLQVCAQSSEGLVFLCRPIAAQFESSAAPLRVQLSLGTDWELRVRLIKRKGPTHDSDVVLHSMPGGLQSIMTPRLMRPSAQLPTWQSSETDVVGSTAPERSSRRRAEAH
jgi:protein ImuA